ncbi:hypothetical protein JWH04_16450 [Xanthomonas melonis]|uniref:hypothetical protein n=1 Tax=Xanthomonas melonis TaxID=56456 RepID=UPI001E3DF173|nr:hypothetical protein [Xanthomonas melonis]MCD0280502.1 hypothetical protein [Xanthomonas melonis]
MSAPVDFRGVIAATIADLRDSGHTGMVENLLEVDAAMAELIEAASGIEGLARLAAAPLRDYRAAVDRLTAALARVGGAA